jgi:hypothetical protein
MNAFLHFFKEESYIDCCLLLFFNKHPHVVGFDPENKTYTQ